MPAVSFRPSAPLLSLKGERLTENDTVITVAIACINALNTSLDDTKISGVKKVRRFNLMLKLEQAAADETEISLESDDISDIKAAAGQIYSPLMVGQLFAILETGENPIKEKAPPTPPPGGAIGGAEGQD